MMKKLYHLSTCSTCQRIAKELNLSDEVQMREIKSEPLSAEELDKMAEMAGSYEALFSRRAQKYKSMGLKVKELGEQDYRQLLLEEYTFLKRPVLILGDQIFVGNSKKTIGQAIRALG